MAKFRPRTASKTLGFRVFTFDRQCGGDRPRCQRMAATAQLYLGLDVRVFQPLALARAASRSDGVGTSPQRDFRVYTSDRAIGGGLLVG